VPSGELIATAGRAIAVYILILVTVRALGKRTVGNFSAFDLLVALMLSEVVDEIIYGDVRFLQGTVAIAVIGGLAYADAWLVYLNRTMRRLLEGTPTTVVRDGEFDRRGMRKERMNEMDVLGHLRMQGIHDMREVRLAVVEIDGSLSVLKHTWADPAQKADVLKTEETARARTIGSEDMPPPEKRTDSPKALRVPDE
jgi:uncharacterized membrane protein YcaP (DUF421 family)